MADSSVKNRQLLLVVEKKTNQKSRQSSVEPDMTLCTDGIFDEKWNVFLYIIFFFSSKSSSIITDNFVENA
jgi:hypothetical protein